MQTAGKSEKYHEPAPVNALLPFSINPSWKIPPGTEVSPSEKPGWEKLLCPPGAMLTHRETSLCSHSGCLCAPCLLPSPPMCRAKQEIRVSMCVKALQAGKNEANLEWGVDWVYYLREGTICNQGCFSSLISHSQIICEGALRVNIPSCPSELALMLAVFKAFHESGSPLEKKASCSEQESATGPLLAPWSRTYCQPVARAGLTAARTSGHALEGVTLMPNNFGCHPAQV